MSRRFLTAASTTPLAAILLTVATVVAPALALDRAPPEWRIGATVTGAVIQVIDGDTLRVRSGGGLADVRLHALDAPEANQTCARPTGVSFQCGAEATAQMVDILHATAAACPSGHMHGTCLAGSGVPISCEVLDLDRRWGRPVARCFLGPTDVARELVVRGYARASYAQDYVLLAAAARFQKRGLWSGTWIDPAAVRHGRSVAP
ncbi:thermonuclease family protein [Azospirillum canadense]|uniref:thermonuclease family protein n=1 Tax=Azospirillum canadense TaxID=403962 RepID=UPI0022264FC8|nr:thermonuclease family protein [Azospirillum canadense]MCW2240693.1 endonuclease YncB(thermonuclease family) [Azospirillum canadense]